MLQIDIRTIHHVTQRYETVGDYWTDANGTQHIRVSDMGDWRYEFLVALHEMIEQALCRRDNVAEDLITQFDKDFESKRKPGNVDEPGNDPSAPYHKQHKFATFMERAMAFVLDVDWEKYSEYVEGL